jgi:hypothetical protein
MVLWMLLDFGTTCAERRALSHTNRCSTVSHPNAHSLWAINADDKMAGQKQEKNPNPEIQSKTHNAE